MSSCETLRDFTLESSTIRLRKDTEESSGEGDSSKIIDVDAICHENGCEREAKRPRSLGVATQSSSSKKMSKSLSEKTNSLFAEEINQGPSGSSLCKSSKSPALDSVWCCTVCTYTNNELLPYCEMCDSPRNDDGK